MDMYQTLRATLTDCMSRNDPQAVFEKNLIRTIIGEVQRTAKSDDVPDDDVKKVVKKMIECGRLLLHELRRVNKDTSSPRYCQINEEVQYLRDLLPNLVEGSALTNALLAGADLEICQAKNDGQATGIANKYLRSKNYDTFGDDVKDAVAQIRKGVNNV